MAAADVTTASPPWLTEVSSRGWDEGMRKVGAILPPDDAALLMQYVLPGRAGWRFLLGPPPWKRVLCVDSRLGATSLSLADNCEELVVTNPDRLAVEAIARRIDQSGYKHLKAVPFGPDLSSPVPEFDSVVIEDAIAAAAGSSSAITPKAFFTMVRAWTRPEGEAFVGVLRRPLDASRLLVPETMDRSLSLFTFSACRQAAEAAGFDVCREYPMLSSPTALREVLIPGGNVSAQTIGVRHAVKARLLNSPARSMFTGATGFLFGPREHRSFLASVPELPTHAEASPAKRAAARVVRYQMLSGKVILTIRNGSTGSIVVLPLLKSFLRRRDHEYRIIERLSQLSGPMSEVTPRPMGRGELGTQTYLIQEERAGVPVDSPRKELWELTHRAAAVLVAFQCNHRSPVIIGDESFGSLFGDSIRRVARRFELETDESFKTVEEDLRNAVLGRNIPLVWTHGDFKIENVLFEPRTLAVCGVIDWDLSEESGLPLLDLMYLLAYNRGLRLRKDITRVILDVLGEESWTPAELELIRGYCRALGVAPEILPVLKRMLWFHHMAYRFRPDARIPTVVEKAMEVVHWCASHPLEQSVNR